jgi:hypothetical protein
MDSAHAQLLVETGSDQVAALRNAETEISSKSIASVDDLAELILTTKETKRLLIAFGGLAGSEPNDHATVLAGRLLARHGTERAVRWMLDSAPQEEAVKTLSNVVWEGQEGSYSLAHQGEDVGALRGAVLCLTALVIAHLEKGPKGVDSVANSTPLLKLRPAKKAAARSMPPSITDRRTQALIELVAASGDDDTFVVLGDHLVAMPVRAANALVAQWQGWMQVAKDRDFNVEQAVALTPCLPSGALHVVVAHLKESTQIRALSGSNAPPVANVARCLSRMSAREAKRAALRLHAVFFKAQYETVDTFLMACLGNVLKNQGAS